jgi:hypothetical protein
MDAIGCSSTSLKNGTKGVLNSYQTSYDVKAATKKNDILSSKLKSFLSSNGKSKTSKGSSFYCYDAKGETKPKILKKANKNSCCLDLGFKTGANASGEISHALTYEFINRRIGGHFKGKLDPSWKIQRFNGFTNMMGGAESVPAWRVGVNYRENPSYGQQAMDYIVNSLMFNPYIVNKVKNESKKQNKQLNSIICNGKADGSYFLGSDNYFERVQGSTRLEVIAKKHAEGNAYNDLTEREKSVINRELREVGKTNPYMPNLLRGAVYKKYEKQIKNKLGIEVDNLFEMIKKPNKEIWNENKHVIPKDDFDYLMSAWDRLDDFKSKIDDVNLKISSAEKKIELYCKTVYKSYLDLYNGKKFDQAEAEYSKYNNCVQNKDDFGDAIYNANKNNALSILSGNPTFGMIIEDWHVLIEKKKSSVQDYNSYLKLERTKMTKVFNKSSELSQKIFEQRSELESIPDAQKRLGQLFPNASGVSKAIASLHPHVEAQGRPEDMEKAFRYYFSNQYQDRKTLGQASDYSWKKLSLKQVERLTEKILKE